MNADHHQTGRLVRELGLLDAVAVGIGAIIGAGIFVVTGVAANVAGPAFILALILAGVVATINALSSAELAAEFPSSGGTYEYGYELLNPWAGFAAGWMFLVSKLAAGGTVAIGFGSYLAVMIPGVSPQAATMYSVVALTLANYFGIKKIGKLNLLIVSITIATLVYYVVCGIPYFDTENLTPFFERDPMALLESAGLLFFAFTGYARIATLAEEVKDPQITIPRAIVISLSIAVALYLAVSLIATGTVGAAALGSTNTPLAVSAQAIKFPGVSLAIGIGATTAMFGVLLSQILGISRMMFAMSRRGDLPKLLDHVSPRYSSPDCAILATGFIILLLAIFGSIDWIVGTATFTILLYYTITNISALKLPHAAKLFPRWIGMAGLTFCLMLAFSLSPKTFASGLAILAFGFIYRFLFRLWISRSRSNS